MSQYRLWALGFVVAISLLLGFYIECLPLPVSLSYFKPSLLMMVGLYWVLAFPSTKAFGFAFLLCLLMDHVHGVKLGVHAMCVLPMVYIVMLFHRQLRMLPIWQMAIWIAVMIVVSRGIYVSFTKTHLELILWISGNFVHILLWPMIFSIMRYARQSCGTGLYHTRFSIGP